MVVAPKVDDRRGPAQSEHPLLGLVETTGGLGDGLAGLRPFASSHRDCRPEGGEAMAMRAVFAYLQETYGR